MKRHGLMSLLIAAVLLLAALPAWAEFTPKLDPDTHGRVTVLGNYNNFEALESAFERFNRYYPDVELTYTKLDSYNRMIATAIMNEEGADIYCVFDWMIGREDYQAVLEAEETLNAPGLDIDFSCFDQNLIYTNEQGAVPMIPVFVGTFGMLVNEDLFTGLNLKVPANLTELLEASAELKRAGYESPMMGYMDASGIYNIMYYGEFCRSIRGNAALIERLNALDPSAGESLRGILERMKGLLDAGVVDPGKCANEISDNYNQVILRFFEGDVPMMLATGDTVSGTLKRESQSAAFTERPFNYSFYPVPVAEDGGVFAKMVSLNFAVNKNSASLDIANEFIRFLCTAEEMNHMAEIKRLATPTTDLSLDDVLAPFGEVSPELTVYEREIGLLDAATRQVRAALYQVATGAMTVDEAVAGFGSLPE